MNRGSACAISGASGYLGSALVDHLSHRGWTVYRLARSGGSTRDLITWDLHDDPSPGLFEDRGITHLVHGAWDFSARTREQHQRANVDGSSRLLSAARRGGVSRIVTISTISAFAGCRSLYGRAKLAVEATTQELGGIAIRPGLIYDDFGASTRLGGMFGSLVDSVRSGGLVPLFSGGRDLQYLVHRDDLCRYVVALCDEQVASPKQPFVLAHERPLTMRSLVADIGRAVGVRPRILPVPWRAVWAGLRLAEVAHMPLDYRSDSVISLVHQDPRPALAPGGSLGFDLRPFSFARVLDG